MTARREPNPLALRAALACFWDFFCVLPDFFDMVFPMMIRWRFPNPLGRLFLTGPPPPRRGRSENRTPRALLGGYKDWISKAEAGPPFVVTLRHLGRLSQGVFLSPLFEPMSCELDETKSRIGATFGRANGSNHQKRSGSNRSSNLRNFHAVLSTEGRVVGLWWEN